MKKLSKSTLKKFNSYRQKFHRNYYDENMCLSLTVTNKTKNAITVPLFGAVDDNTDTDKFIKPDFDIQYSSILKTLLSKKLYIDKIRVQSSNIMAITNTITIFNKNIWGQSLSQPMNISCWIKSTQVRLDIVESDNRNLIIDNDTSLIVDVPANSTVQYSFFESKFFKFKYKISNILGNTSFSKLIINLLDQSNLITKKFDINPYLHENKNMDIYCNEIKREISRCIKDNSFEITLHKNLIDLFDKLKPFVDTYLPIINDSEPFFKELEDKRIKDMMDTHKSENISNIKLDNKKIDNSKSSKYHKKALAKRGLLPLPSKKKSSAKKNVKKPAKRKK